ncbi:MAG: hypothetical protein Kow0074_25240 [Candidatus Zixiibacteriota bacterium]
MSVNPLKKLAELGQSIWLDYIRRDLYQGPELKRMIDEDGLAGMTSNPSIFQKAIGKSDLYDDSIQKLADKDLDIPDIFEKLAVEDVQNACDVFRSVYDATGGNDGFVSIEVNPHLAHETEKTIAEAKRLWQDCNRPNVMIKIPGTKAGLPAIRRCLADGININVTLLFSVKRYREVMDVFADALEERLNNGLPVDKLRSVASFFVSRVDSNVDKKLDAIIDDKSRSDDERKLARSLRGTIAIANTKLAYAAFEEWAASDRVVALKNKGVALQRPLWGSTSTKDDAYPDTVYVDELIAPYSVNTIPPETYDAYKDHGDPAVRIRDNMDEARRNLDQLKTFNIDIDAVTQELEDEGVRKFADSYDSLIETLNEKVKKIMA